MTGRPLLLLLVSLAGAAALAGCASSSSPLTVHEPTGGSENRSLETGSPTSSGVLRPAPETGSPGGRLRARLLAEATDGLEIASGRLILPPRPAVVVPDPTGPAPEDVLARGRPFAALGLARERFLADPGPDSLETLASILAAAGAAETALAAWTTLLGIRPDSLGAGLGAAAALEQLGRRDEAVARFEKTLEHHPEEMELHRRLALAAFRAGDATLARLHRDRTRELGGSVPRLLELRLDGGDVPRATVVPGDWELIPGPEVRVDSGGSAGANETSVSASADGQRILVGWNDDRVAGGIDLGVGRSQDGGALWAEELLDVPEAADTGLVGDPMTAFDARTGDQWIGGIAFAAHSGKESAVVVARWPAESAGLEETVVVFQDSGFVDKCWMATGALPGMPDQTRVYVAFSRGVVRSADLGATWSAPVPLGSDNGYLPRVGPDGTLFVGSRTNLSPREIRFHRSDDGGLTFGPTIPVATILGSPVDAAVPGSMRIGGFPSFAVDPRSGRLAMVWSDDSAGDGDVDLHLSFSEDGGDTWSTPTLFDVPEDPVGDQFMPWIEADEWGGLHLMWFDTRFIPQDDGDADAWFDIVYATSADGGATWREVRLTSESSNSDDSQFFHSAQFLGDYLGFSVRGLEAAVAYPITPDGDADIVFRRLRLPGRIFEDGFESGDLAAW